MKKFIYLFLALLIVACSSDDSSDNGGDGQSSCPIYLDSNGITIKACDDANVGDTGVIGGVVYVVVSEPQLRVKIQNGEDVTKVVTSKITNMQQLFQAQGPYYENTFNQNISSWDVSNVTNMSEMFSITYGFNQPIGYWDVGSVTDMSSMFHDATYFNQPIGDWDVSNVTNMASMFEVAVFDQPIGSWDVSSVTDMGYMFYQTDNFDQDISNWNVTNVTDCYAFSTDAPLTEENTPNFTNCTP